MSVERWVPVVGYRGLYEVSDKGRVKSLKRDVRRKNDVMLSVAEKILMPMRDKRGYLRVSLCAGEKPSQRLVHQLVCEAFLGPCPTGKEVAHGDRTPSNCALSNLRYATHGENMADMAVHGVRKGERSSAAKLTYQKAMEIRGSTDSLRVAAAKNGVTPSTVWAIRKRITWTTGP